MAGSIKGIIVEIGRRYLWITESFNQRKQGNIKFIKGIKRNKYFIKV